MSGTNKENKLKKYSETKSVENRKIAEQLNKENRRKLFLIVMGVLLVTAPVLFYSWQRVELYQYGYKIEKANKTLRKMRNENSRLKLEKKKLLRFDRVRSVARKNLGLRKSSLNSVTLIDLKTPGERENEH